MTWTEDFVATGRAAEERAAAETCGRCGTQKEVGYSNLGVPIVVCPTCSPSLYANREKPVGEALGFREPS